MKKQKHFGVLYSKLTVTKKAIISTKNLIKALIFDLDDTLYDCSGSLSKNRRREVSRILARHKGCSQEEALQLLQKDEEVCKYGRYEGIAHRFQLPQDFLEEIQAVLEKFPNLSQIKLFPDVAPTLQALRGRGLKVFLVTSGKKEEQEAKLRHLGLSVSGGLMDEVMIVKRDGEGKVKGKCFQHLLEKHNLTPQEVICVGDRIEDELSAAIALGMHTAMIKHGQHYQRFANTPRKEMLPDFFIENISELLSLLS